MGLLETTISGRKRRNSHAHVVSELGSAIVSGRIAEGSLLPNDAELSMRFGVSRTVLRETMKTLAAKRLVEPNPFQYYRPMSDALVEIVEPVIGKDNPSLQAMKAVGDRYIEQHGTPVVKDDDYLLPTEHHEGEDTE